MRSRIWPRSRAIGGVLMYHRVATPQVDVAQLSVSPEFFAEQMAVLSRELVVPLADLPTSPGAIAITFDDGYLDNLDAALPVLERFGLPATFFVVADALDGCEFWWDALDHRAIAQAGGPQRAANPLRIPIRQRARGAVKMARYRRLSPAKLTRALPEAISVPETPCTLHRKLDAEALRRLAASPYAEIGSHTCTHPNLTTLDAHAQMQEISRSRAILEEVIGEPVTSFSYPYGTYDEVTMSLVRRAGFERACIVGGGLLRTTSDPMAIPRTMVRNWPGGTFSRRLRYWKAARWLA